MVSLDVTISGQALLWFVAGLSLTTLLLIALMRRYFHSRSGQNPPPDEKRRASERNKYNFANVFRFRGTFLQYGLVLSLGLAVLGFAWTEFDEIPNYSLTDLEELPELLVSPPTTTSPPPPPPPPPTPVLEPVPDEEVLEDEEPEFVDLSISDEDPVFAPAPVVEESLPPPPPPPAPEPENITEIFKFVEEMPLFPGCDDLSSKEERKKCSDRELMSFLSNNIKYPAIARENGIEGTAYITFVVEKNGRITDPEITRAPGGGLGEEALRVIKLMNEKGITWTPGQQRKVPVRVMFTLPVKFKLQ